MPSLIKKSNKHKSSKKERAMPFPPGISLEVSWNGKEKASSDP